MPCCSSSNRSYDAGISPGLSHQSLQSITTPTLLRVQPPSVGLTGVVLVWMGGCMQPRRRLSSVGVPSGPPECRYLVAKQPIPL